MNELLINTLAIEYQREIERKTKLESKALSYVTIVSIISATSVGLLIYVLQLASDNIVLELSYIIIFTGNVYYSILTIISSLFSLKMRDLTNIDAKDLESVYFEKDEYILGTLFKTYTESIEINISYNKKIENSNGIAYSFLWITIVMFMVQMAFSIAILFGGIK